jgi:hypothetical protein
LAGITIYDLGYTIIEKLKRGLKHFWLADSSFIELAAFLMNLSPKALKRF